MRPYALLGLLVAPAACSTAATSGPAPPPGCAPVETSEPALPPTVLAHPPADRGGPPPASDDVAVFAIRHIWVGDLDPATGEPSSTAWATLGFDIDGKVTSKCSTDVCQLAPGASRTTQIDGQGGADNSFGANVMPMLDTIFPAFQPCILGPCSGVPAEAGESFRDSISAGKVTDLIVVRGLGSGPTVSPLAPLAASFVVAAPLGKTPSWSADDVWPFDPSSLWNADAGAPLLAFAQSYVTGGVLVAEPPSGGGEIALGYAGPSLFVMPVRHVQIAMTLSADGMSATSGTISGVIPVDRLVEAFRPLFGTVSPSFCSASAFGSFAQQLEQAADILLDGTNDPSQACDGVSIGLGFDAVRVQVGPVADILPQPDPCADAGP
jgi:hypothetical protein